MNKRYWPVVLVLLALLGAPLWASGGLGGGDAEESGDDTIKVSLKPLEEESKIYGWVRVTGDQFNLGANRLPKDQWYSVYFVSGDEKQAVGENPVTRSSGSGEVKFGTRLEEPLGAEWDKVVLYHQPQGEKNNEGMVPVLEGSLR